MQATTTAPLQINLDYLAAKYGRKIAQETVGQDCAKGQVKGEQARNTVQKALGILQESGLYAVVVWLLSKAGNVTGNQQTWGQNCKSEEEFCSLIVLTNLFQLANESQLASIGIALPEAISIHAWEISSRQNRRNILEHFSDTITASLDRLIFTRHIYDQTLVYALFITKALG